MYKNNQVNAILREKGPFCPFSLFFRDKSHQKKKKNSNQLEFESNLFTNNIRKFEVAKVTESFPVLRCPEVAFRNLQHFQQNSTLDVFVT